MISFQNRVKFDVVNHQHVFMSYSWFLNIIYMTDTDAISMHNIFIRYAVCVNYALHQ